jgi:uncharacterized protein
VELHNTAFKNAVALSKEFVLLPLFRIALALTFIYIPLMIANKAFNAIGKNIYFSATKQLTLSLIAILSYALYVRVIERRSTPELSSVRMFPELGNGILLGAILFLMVISALAALGAYQVSGMNSWVPVIASVPLFIQIAVVEEIIFRGIIFRIAELSLGSWIALILSAIIFGLVHFANTGATLTSTIAIAIEAGILLAAAFMLTRRLWLCTAIHFSWNFTQGGIFSCAVSGSQKEGLLKAKLIGSEWLTGGQFGVEASLIAVIICLTTGLYLILKTWKNGTIIKPFWKRKL